MMKKFFGILVMAAALAVSASAAPAANQRVRQNDTFSEINWGEKLALYLPNRILDMFDLFSINLGIGPVAEARLMFTRYADVGAGYSAVTYKAYKDYNRQYGLGIEEGWYWSFVAIGEEEFTVRDGSLLVDKYTESRAGMPMPYMRAYDFYEGPRDFWAIGGSLGLLVDGNVYLHPVEWVDFALGFLLIDIKDDDLTFDSFNR